MLNQVAKWQDDGKMMARGKPGWIQTKLQQMQISGLYTLKTVRNHYVSS
jgi:hypothetical protein